MKRLFFLFTMLIATAAAGAGPYTKIQLRRDTPVNWASFNPTLALGEPGCELTGSPLRCTAQKIGDGTTHWLDLPYTQVALGLGVDVRAYGAKCDGVTNDTAAIASALTYAGATSEVVIPGVCGITDTIILGDRQKLRIVGRLKALPGMDPAKSMIKITAGNSTTPAWYTRITGGGTIDGSNIVDAGIEVYFGRQVDLSHLEIIGVNKYGVVAGNVGTSYASTEANLDHVVCRWHQSSTPLLVNGSYANDPGSIGIYHRNCTDSIVTNSQSVGFRKGFVAGIGAGSTQYSHNHAWGGRVHGPFVTGFEDLSSGNTHTGDYADTPHNWYSPDGSTSYVQNGSITAVYGFAIRSYSQAHTGCKVFLNTSNAPYNGSTNNLLTAVYMDPVVAPAGYYGYLNGFQIQGGSDSYKYAAAFGGVTDHATIQGLNVDATKVVDTASIIQQTSETHPQEFRSANTFSGDSVFTGGVVFSSDLEFTGSPVFNSNGTDGPIIQGAPGTYRSLFFGAGTSRRWSVRATDSAESGSNNGSDFKIQAYDDTGVFLSNPLTLNRRNGTATFGGPVEFIAASSSIAPSNSVFRDVADNVLKTRNNAGSLEKIITTGNIGDTHTATATAATTGAMTTTVVAASSVFTITPTGDCTFNASGGAAGQRITFVITTSGTTTRNLTWGTNFKSTGVLATGAADAKVFTVSFVCTNGTTWVETSRTVAM